jgi:hypothetical protein
MTRLLPSVLTTADLPLAELCAARLDGEVYAVDGCFAAVDELEESLLRATALAHAVPPRTIAERLTALWIYGVLAAPPARHTLCVANSTRARVPPSQRWVVRECALRDGDVVRIAGTAVVSPLHAALDLLRCAEPFGSRERRWVAELMAYGGFQRASCAEQLEARPSAPGTVQARRRLAA